MWDINGKRTTERQRKTSSKWETAKRNAGEFSIDYDSETDKCLVSAFCQEINDTRVDKKVLVKTCPIHNFLIKSSKKTLLFLAPNECHFLAN